ncbi:MAG TPA: lysylphosphatidylglycerol synthase transmembrane domain-containing protein [Pseudonocardiaceae bacterium]|jgi:hypothetical protein|nr:lysylphosphatidylglycerol synthase transmembrane domain-containing protein [Pseudonocardiaceae bacterium]
MTLGRLRRSRRRPTPSAGSDAHPVAAGTRRRAPLLLRRGLGLVAVLLILEYGVLPQIAGARHALTLLKGVDPILLGVGLLLEAGALLAYSLLTREVLPAASRPPVRTLLRIDITSLGVSHLMPGGTAVAAAMRLRMLTGCGVRPTDALFSATVQGAGSAVVLNVMLWMALAVSIPTHHGNILSVIAVSLGLALCTAAALVVLAVTRGQRPLIRVLRAVAAWIPGVRPDAVEDEIRTITGRMRAFGADRCRLARATSWAAANWLLDAASLGVFVAAFGHLVDIVGLFIGYGLANVLAVVPVTPGGLGIIEGVLVPSLVAFGSPRGVAIFGVISWRLVNFWLPIPVSAMTYLSLRAGPLQHHPTRERLG